MRCCSQKCISCIWYEKIKWWAWLTFQRTISELVLLNTNKIAWNCLIWNEQFERSWRVGQPCFLILFEVKLVICLSSSWKLHFLYMVAATFLLGSYALLRFHLFTFTCLYLAILFRLVLQIKIISSKGKCLLLHVSNIVYKSDYGRKKFWRLILQSPSVAFGFCPSTFSRIFFFYVCFFS